MNNNERTHHCQTCGRSYKKASELTAHETTPMHLRQVAWNEMTDAERTAEIARRMAR